MRVVVVALLALLMAGCGAGGGGTLIPSLQSREAQSASSPPSPVREPTLEATAVPTDPSTSSEATQSVRFTLTSPAFPDGAAIPRTYSCDGRDISPPLTWSGVPAGTIALLLTVTDPDARGFVHWTAWDLEPDLGGLPDGASGSLPGGAREGRNDFGRIGWGGPCPPSGTHRYEFRLTGLSARLGLPRGTELVSVLREAAAATVGTATLVGTYRR
jgi:Raf kinase inhibitor-like YbhB/YbcL family protein